MNPIDAGFLTTIGVLEAIVCAVAAWQVLGWLESRVRGCVRRLFKMKITARLSTRLCDSQVADLNVALDAGKNVVIRILPASPSPCEIRGCLFINDETRAA